jgi:ubiquinol-cytochrome c reductase cytochrome b subunit
MLGIILTFQIITGILLSFNYVALRETSFFVSIIISRERFNGFLLRTIHLNFASAFFLFVYLHFTRGLYFFSFKLRLAWASGTSILLILIATAFLGYVLPWGQISLWGATVITNLISAIPLLGKTLVVWV